MTLRLVGLMTAVLLLCLAAFAYLMNRHQQQVMEELQRTVSEVGQATLRGLEEVPQLLAGHGELAHRIVEEHLDAAHAGEEGRQAPPVEADGKRIGVRRMVQIREGEACAEDEKGGVWVVTATGPVPPTIRKVVDAEGKETLSWVQGDQTVEAEIELRGETAGNVGTMQILADGIHAGGGAFFVRTEDVLAEVDPSEGMVLKILARESDEHANELVKQEFRLPIATADYQEHFSSLKRSSLAMFLGVFLVGSVLSASLAARFTRPVRRLDAGIRRLGEGELEVEVDVNGRGEMGRLGRAFNEMARRLRLNRERERELTRREKLSSLGRLASGVAHDVRNPLHSIGLTLQHLQETGRPAEPGRAAEFDRSLAIIREEIARLDRLVDNFLRFARSSPQRREELDLADLLHETVRLVEKQAERLEIHLAVEVEGEPRRIHADPEAIRSAVLNLVLNGFEAMPRGGTLTLSLSEVGGEVRVEVADTGEGIAAEDREKVFDFAYTTRDGGHGLGLAMVHQAVVEGHGGRVSLESAPGEGTRVLLDFPPEAGEEPS